MKHFRWVLSTIVSLFAAPVLAQTAYNAPVNLAPNSQWEIMSGWSFSTQENYLGTGTVGPIAASANTTGSIGRSTFTVTTTKDLSVGDLVQASGSGIDSCFAVSPMRIVAMTANASITVRTPYGCKPSVSHATTLLPITAGNQSIIATGSGPDGWLKTATMPMWRNENRGPYAANLPTDIGAYAALGMTKDSASAEYFYTDISQMAPKRRPIEGKIAVWDGIAQPDFGVLALSAAP